MKYYLIAGEASGDLHASNLMKALKEEDGTAVFRCWGGDKMEAAGGHLVKHYRELAFMGFVEVLKNLSTIRQNIRFCKEDIQAFQPDVLILIDYSGFNLRIAKWAKSFGQKVFYYIAPQVWASRPKRTYTIKENVDEIFTILPFEETFYEQYDVPVNYVGHPLLDVTTTYPFQKNFVAQHQLQLPYIALLPGSRKQEIRRILPLLLTATKKFPTYQFVLAAAPAISLEFYNVLIKEATVSQGSIHIIQDATYDILNNATAAIVTSGTATLETALLDVPQIVVYKGSPITYQIAKRVITVPYLSLVNLIADRPLVKELLQDELSVDNLEKELRLVLEPSRAKEIKEGYQFIKDQLGNAGASERAAKLMVKYLTTEQ